MLLVVSTVRAGSRLLITKLAPTTSACAVASAAGHSAAAAPIRRVRASRTPVRTTRDALILNLLPLGDLLAPWRHGSKAGRIVARPAGRRTRRLPPSAGPEGIP